MSDLRDYALSEAGELDVPREVREGTPDRPGKPRHVWTIDLVAPDGVEDDDGHGFFYIVQRVAGTWEPAEDNDYEVVWKQRASWMPPITRMMYAFLDDRGVIVNVHREERHKLNVAKGIARG